MNYEMIIFDVDGTLCNIVDIVTDCVNKVLQEENINESVTSKTIESCQGLNHKDFAQKSMPFLDDNISEDYLTKADELKSNYIKQNPINIYDNVKDTIIKLSQKYKLAIVSNCSEGYVELIMDKIGITNYILDFIPASAYHITKAEAITKIMKDNDINKAIYVGDTILDQLSCEKSGIDFIYASYGFGKNVRAKYEISNFKELISLMENID